MLNEPVLFISAFTILIFIGFATMAFTKYIALKLIHKIIRKTKTDWDDLLIQHGVIESIAKLGVFVLLKLGNTALFSSEASILKTNDVIISILIVLACIGIAEALLNLSLNVLQKLSKTSKFPAKSFIQALKLISYFFGVIFILSILLDKSPVFFISGLGALTAVLLLVFKDSILGLVAGIQVSANNLIQVGDWIELPSHNANGTVKDVSLTTLKVENWDQTISSIPMQALITNSFKNWRNMSESNGRRIKRSIIIDANSVEFLDAQHIEQLKKITLLKPYLEEKVDALKKYDLEHSENQSDTPKIQRRLTNIGTFRAYCLAYLKHNPMVNSDMTLIVRQLTPKESGIPIEIWTYSNTTDWIQYEGIQSDIFDHLYSILSEFKLEAYQKPSGLDFHPLQVHTHK
jgi:miniconductance mechanosensitive channel